MCGGGAATLFIVAAGGNLQPRNTRKKRKTAARFKDLGFDFWLFGFRMFRGCEKLPRVTVLDDLFHVRITFSLGRRGRSAGSTVATQKNPCRAFGRDFSWLPSQLRLFDTAKLSNGDAENLKTVN